jgi:hypothetical protein
VGGAERLAYSAGEAAQITGLSRHLLLDKVRTGPAGLPQGRLPPHHHPPAPGSLPHPKRILTRRQDPSAPQELIHSCAHIGPGGHQRAGTAQPTGASR